MAAGGGEGEGEVGVVGVTELGVETGEGEGEVAGEVVEVELQEEPKCSEYYTSPQVNCIWR